jgi:hypothetical protein
LLGSYRTVPYMWLLVEPAHFVVGRRQLLGIRQRAQAKLGDRLGSWRRPIS